MQPVAQSLHVREFLIGLDAAVRRPLVGLPGIVDVHVGIAVIGQPPVDEGGGRGHHLLLRHAQGPAVPAVPAHGRSQADLVAHFQGEFRPRLPLRVPGDEHQRIVSRHRAASAQDSFLGIQHNALRKSLHSIFHGLFAREGQSEDDRGTGAYAKHQRAVIARCGGCRRREDVGCANLGLQDLFETRIGIGHFEPLLRGQRAGKLLFLPGGKVYFLRPGRLFGTAQDILHGNVQGARGFHGRSQNGFVTARFRYQGKIGEILQTGFDNLDGAAVEPTRIAVIIHPHGNHVFPVPSHPFGVHDIIAALPPFTGIAARVFREGTGLSDPVTIDPGLVGVIDGP